MVKYIRLSPFYEISMITISFARCKVALYALCSNVLMRSNCNGSNDNAMKYVLLHLPGGGILMHHLPFVTNENSVHSVLDDCVFEWEKCLLKSLLGAVTLKSTICSAIQSIDMEIAWQIVGLLIRWSVQTQSKVTNIQPLVDSMTVLLYCDQGSSMERKRSTVTLGDSISRGSVACRHMNS